MDATLPPTLSQELSSWIEHLRQEDRAASTLRDYEADVRCFLGWLQSTGGGLSSFSAVGSADARGFRDALLESHPSVSTGKRLSPATINRRLGTLASLLTFLDVPDSKNPFRRLRRIEKVQTAPKSLGRNEWNAVRRAAAELEKRDGGLALAVVSLLRHAGLRAGELVALSMADITLGPKSGQVQIRQGKGLKARAVPLNSEAREGLESWVHTRAEIAKRHRERAGDEKKAMPTWTDERLGCFFVGQRGPFTRRGIGQITQKLGEKAGLPYPLGPHRLRHTFAKAAIDPEGYGLKRDAVPLPALQKILGHARIETTAIYTQFSDGDLARLLEERSEEI